MADLAVLGLRIESDEAEVADQRLDGLAASAAKAERATDALAGGTRSADGAIAKMVASIEIGVRDLVAMAQAELIIAQHAREAAAATNTLAGATSNLSGEAREAGGSLKQLDAHMDAYRASLRATQAAQRSANDNIERIPAAHRKATDSSKALQNATLNMTRQFADVAVTIGTMNPFMVLLQQGPQIADGFQVASQAGLGFKDVLRGIWAQLAPILAILAPFVVLIGAVAAAFALMSRDVSKDVGDLKNTLGLTDEQLKRLKKSGEETKVTMGDSFKALGTTIKEEFLAAFGAPLKAAGGAFSKFLDDLWQNTLKEVTGIVGLFIGAYFSIQAAWKNLPAAIGDAAVSAANAAIAALNFLIQKSVDGINALRANYNNLPAWMRNNQTAPMATARQIAPMNNPYAGGMAAAGAGERESYERGAAEAAAWRARVGARFRGNARDTATARIREAAGDPNKESGATKGATDAERAYEQLIKSGEAYRLGLVKERQELGMTALERKRLESETMANNLVTKGATDASRALAAEIRKEQKALEDATLAYEHSNAMKKQGQTLQLIELEREMIGKSNVERARQVAMLQTEIELRNRLGSLAEAYINSAAGQGEIKGAGDVAAAGAENSNATTAYNLGLEYQLDLLHQIDDQAKAAGRGLADAFGEAGGALGDLLTTMTGFRAQMEEINQAERRYRESVGEGAVDQRRLAMFARERGQAEVEAYGQALSAAKGFFKEGSDGYKVLQAAEQVYRVMQFANMLQSIALGGQETAFTVGQNAIKAASHGVVAVARALASLPFPFNIAAGIATAAALAAIGVAIFGGGKGGGGGSRVSDAADSAQGFTATDQKAQEGAANSFAALIRIETNDDKFNAYVDRRVQPAAVASYTESVSTARSTVPADMSQKNSNTLRVGRR